MKQNPSEKIKQILDDLERELFEIKSAILNHCAENPQFNHMRIVFGISRLDSLFFTPDEFQDRISNLRMNYLNMNSKFFGSYYEKEDTL